MPRKPIVGNGRTGSGGLNIFGIPGVGTLGRWVGGIGGIQTPTQNMYANDRGMLMDFIDQQGRPLNPAVASTSDLQMDQRDLVGRLRALSEGRGPSLAQEQMRQSMDRATNQQYAMAAGARGNPALAQRQAMNQAGAIQSAAAGQSAQARAAEQLGAMAQMGGVVDQGRRSDETLNMFNAGQQNAMQSAQDALRLRAIMGMNQMTQAYDNVPTFWENAGKWLSGGMMGGGGGQQGGQGGGGGGGGGGGLLGGLLGGGLF